MSGPIRPNPPNQAPRLPPTGQTHGSGRGTTPETPSAVGGEPARPRAPTLPAGGAGSSSAPRGAAPTRSGTTATGPALRGAGATPAMALTTLANELATLEQQRTALAARLATAREARDANPGRAGNAQSRAELAKLQDRLHRANEQLQGVNIKRADQLGRLEKAERLLASCERALERSMSNLSIAAPAAETDAPVAMPTAPLAAAVAPKARVLATRLISPEEAQLKAQIPQLERAAEAARAQKASAQQTLAAARQHAERIEAKAESVLSPVTFMPLIEKGASDRLATILAGHGLPAPNQLPAAGQTDSRFARYLEHYTEVDSAGRRRLAPDVAASPASSIFAVLALTTAVSPTHVMGSVLIDLLRGRDHDLSAIAAAVRDGGNDLEQVVRARIMGGWDYHTEMTVITANAGYAAARGPRRRLLQGVTTHRNDVQEIAAHSAQLLQLAELPEHRQAIIDGAVAMSTALLRGIVKGHVRAMATLATANADLEATKASVRPAFTRALQADQALAQAKARLGHLVDERHQQEAAEARAARAAAQAVDKAKARPAGPTVPQTEVASSSAVDEEARQLKLRGDLEKHTEAAEAARQALAGLDQEVRQAQGDVRRAEDQYETAEAAQSRGRAGARRRHAEQRDEIGQLRRELANLDGQVAQAQTALEQHAARRSLISDRAWERAVERHVEPDDAALRARSRQTGYAGAYGSRADMAQAVSDIHAGLAARPEFQAVLAARTRAEFERAVAHMPGGGVTDLVHDHGRPIGRGFSNDADQTDRPTELTQSNFSLQFVQGRVVVSHLYPYVPHRQLTTA
jgi:predicted  nucleic acid-binding Zn-ribbon protein